MFTLHLHNTGKRFHDRWLFRNLETKLHAGESLALIGANGSGKSTLMRILAGQMLASEGKCHYYMDDKKIPHAQMYQHVSWTGPQLQLYPDLSLWEHLALHFRARRCLLGSLNEVIEVLKLSADADKALRFYSSGMYQRVKLGLALFSQSDLLLLDEPTANMDEQNAAYALDLIREFRGNRVFVLASNLEREYGQMPQLRLGKF